MAWARTAIDTPDRSRAARSAGPCTRCVEVGMTGTLRHELGTVQAPSAQKWASGTYQAARRVTLMCVTRTLAVSTVPTGATIWPVEIDGDALRKARKRMGYRSQQAAADAMGVSLRKYGDLERQGVPDEYVEAALRAFWPDQHEAVSSLADFEDIDLLTEIGRRFALYRRERDEALERLAAAEQDPSQAGTTQDDMQSSATLSESSKQMPRRFTGRRPPRPPTP